MAVGRNRISRNIFLLVVAGLLVLFAAIDGRTNGLYFSMHCAIIALSLLHIVRARKFDLGLSYSFFALFFFGLIPLFEYKLGITYNGTTTPRDSSYFTAAWIALLSSAFFYCGYGPGRDRPERLEELQAIYYVGRRHRQWVCIASALGIAALSLFIASYYGFSPGNMLVRGFGEQIESSSFGYSFVNYFARPLLFNLIVLIMLIWTTRTPHSRVAPLFLLVILFAFISPVGIPRSLAGALYIPVLTLVLMPRLYSKYAIICIVIFSVLFAAPVFDIFRSGDLSGQIDLAANFNLSYLFAGHFDAFYNLVQVVELRFSTAGLQLIGALLFWVPRALWPGKPVGTSFDFAPYAGMLSDNVSFPLPAEFYADYGLVGVILGMFLVGVLYRRLDKFLSRKRRPGSLSAYICVIAHQEVAILGIYLLRGSFLGSFSYTVGVASTFAVLAALNGVLRRWEVEKVRMLGGREREGSRIY
jgi:oligosaccharide repeat unit polymerase